MYVRALAWIAAMAVVGAACASASSPRASSPSRVAVGDAASDAVGKSAPVRIQILAINDFHGNLDPPGGSSALVTVPPDDPFLKEHPDAGAIAGPDGKNFVVPAGGVAYLAAYVKRLRSENPNTWMVSAGDLTGASPLVSNLFRDEPTVLAMNLLGLDFEGVGNHDFDRGLDELERLAHGGCSMGDCDAGLGAFEGAHFEYLAANVRRTAGSTVFAPYAIRDMAGVRVAFIGLTLAATPTVTVPSAVRGLTFANEAETVNALLPELAEERVDGMIVLIHLGAHQTGGTYDSCEHLTGDLKPFLDALRPEFDIVVSAHTHQAYDCVMDVPLGDTVGHRLVTSAASFGRVITRFELTWDPDSRKWLDKRAKNLVVSRDVAPDPEVEKLVQSYATRAAPLTSKVVGYVKGNIARGNLGDEPRPGERRACESAAGELIADAQLAATRTPKDGGAQIAFMNPGGVRTDLVSRGGAAASYAVTYADAFEVQPFANRLVTMTLTGQQIREILETQSVVHRLLQVSKGFSYRVTRGAAASADGGAPREGVDLSSVRLGDKALEPKKKYRVTVNSFLAAGGDGFAVFKDGTERQEGPLDLDAFAAYLTQMSSPAKPLSPEPAPHRIGGDACR